METLVNSYLLYTTRTMLRSCLCVNCLDPFASGLYMSYANDNCHNGSMQYVKYLKHTFCVYVFVCVLLMEL